MAITTYTELKSTIDDYVDRDDADAAELITLAEARFKREIRIREQFSRDPLTVDDRYVSLPSGFLEMHGLRLLTDPVTVLREVSPFEMARLRREDNDKPQYFTVHEQIEFDHFPDESYSGEILYHKALTALSDANPTNDLLDRAPDAYLYAALLAAEPFLMNDERLPVWEKLYTSARDALNAMDRKRAGPLVSRVIGDTP